MVDAAYAFDVAPDPTAVGRARAGLRQWLGAHGVPAAVVEDAALILSELVTNAIRHARPSHPDTVTVEARLVGAGLDLAVTDGGGGSVPATVTAPLAEPGGRGLALVALLADRWWWEPSGEGRTVHAFLPVPAER